MKQQKSGGEGRGEFMHRDLLTREEAEDGIARGFLKKGKLRINDKNSNVAFVTVPGVKLDIHIASREDRNRAFDGDVVGRGARMQLRR